MKLTKAQFEQQYRVRLKSKNDSWFMCMVGKVWPKFITYFWTTVRVFGSRPTIYYPTTITLKDDVVMPASVTPILEHELVHVEDMRGIWGLIRFALLYFIFPLPIFFSGRWFLERKAYLVNIVKHGYSIDFVVNMLWESYGWCWPRNLMVNWFIQKALEVEKNKSA